MQNTQFPATKKLLKEDTGLLVCWLIVESVKPSEVSQAITLLNTAVNSTLAVRAGKLKSMLQVMKKISDAFAIGSKPPSQKTVAAFKRTVSYLVASIDMLCRMQEVFTLLSQYTGELSAKATDLKTPGAAATSSSSTPSTPTEQPVTKTIAELLRLLSKDIKFKSEVAKCMAGAHKLNRSAIAVKARKNTDFLRQKGIELFPTQLRGLFVKELLALTEPEFQQLYTTIATPLQAAVAMKQEMAGTKPERLEVLLGGTS